METLENKKFGLKDAKELMKRNGLFINEVIMKDDVKTWINLEIRQHDNNLNHFPEHILFFSIDGNNHLSVNEVDLLQNL